MTTSDKRTCGNCWINNCIYRGMGFAGGWRGECDRGKPKSSTPVESVKRDVDELKRQEYAKGDAFTVEQIEQIIHWWNNCYDKRNIKFAINDPVHGINAMMARKDG